MKMVNFKFLSLIVLSCIFFHDINAQIDYSKYDIYQRAELKPNYVLAWSVDSIDVKVNTTKCQTFKTVSNGNVKTWSNISVEIANKTGRDLVYSKQQTIDVAIKHLAEWDNKLFNTAVDGSRYIEIIITKQVISGKDTAYVFPKGQTWTYDKRVTLVIPKYRNIGKSSNYYAEYTGCKKPYTPEELEIFDFENEKKEAFLTAKFKSVEKLDQKNGKVTIQFDIPFFKKYKLYINDQFIGDFKRGDYYAFEFISNQKIVIKANTKKVSKTSVNKELEFKPGYSYFYVIHAYSLTGKMKELFDDYITLINPDYIPGFLEDKGISRKNFTPAEKKLITGKTLP